MARNYQKESKWKKEKYDLIRASVPKELGAKLRLKLKQENKTIASWIKDNAEEYIEQ